METAKITINYDSKALTPSILDEYSDDFAEIESVCKESEEIAELRKIIFETTEVEPSLYTATKERRPRGASDDPRPRQRRAASG